MMNRAVATIGSLAVAAGLAASGPAAANTAYKWHAQNGVIAFSRTVPDRASLIERFDTGTSAMPSSEDLRELQRDRRIADAAATGLDGRWDRVEAELRESRERLARAKALRDAGREPLPGERLGKVGGGSRLTPAYFERQDALNRGVEKAQDRLDRALQARNDLRG